MTKQWLFTPGPITTSDSVKKAMLKDIGSRDKAFSSLLEIISAGLLDIANANRDEFDAIIIPGSGTNGIESVLSSISNQDAHWLILDNGTYGKRLQQILLHHQIDHDILSVASNCGFDIHEIKRQLQHGHYTHLAMVHCETSSGIENDIVSVGKIAREHHVNFLVDAMSSFAGIPIDLSHCPIDYLISSPNKCLSSVPGFSFVIANKKKLPLCKHNAKTFSLDLHAHWQHQKEKRQCCFTPPTHALLACAEAISELQKEGGVLQRAKRYKNNYDIIHNGLTQLDVQSYLPKSHHSHIITTYNTPKHIDFADFYNRLHEDGFVIYPGIIPDTDTFRIGHIGNIGADESTALVDSISRAITG